MADITASMVKTLRDATNVSMMECKRALQEAEGDLKKATQLLRERGIAIAAKKATRTANEGLIGSATDDNGTAALELAQVRIPCDASADDDGGRNFEVLAREINRLDSLDALQLVNGQAVAVNAVAADTVCHSPVLHSVAGSAHLKDSRLGHDGQGGLHISDA